MHSGWRRAAAAVGLALCGLLLAGCDATGTVVVQADGRMTVDLVVSGDDMVVSSGDDETRECPAQIDSLSVAPQPTPAGIIACRVTGTILPSQLGQVASLTTVGEYQVMRVALQSDGSMPSGKVDVTFRFPGEVLEASSGQIEGDSVRVVDASDFDAGFTIVAVNRSGPPDRVIWAAAGVVGTLLVVGAVWLVRRLRERTPVPSPMDAPAVRRGPPAPDEEPPVAAFAPESFTPPSSEAPATDAYSIWAPPEDGEPGPVD